MPIWCPKCRVMLAEGTEQCPVCGARTKAENNSGFSNKDCLYVTLFILGIGLIPIVLAIVLGTICAGLWQ